MGKREQGQRERRRGSREAIARAHDVAASEGSGGGDGGLQRGEDGGTVALGAGAFMMGLHEWRNDSDDKCRTMGAAVCLPPTTAESGSSSLAQQQLAVMIHGLGSGVTTLRQGATAQISFWAPPFHSPI